VRLGRAHDTRSTQVARELHKWYLCSCKSYSGALLQADVLNKLSIVLSSQIARFAPSLFAHATMNRPNPWQSRRPSAASASGHRQSVSSQIESTSDTTTLSAALGLSLTASEHLASHISDHQLAKEALSLTMLLKGAEQIAKSFDR
jgi:hypothetical protein